SWIFAWLDSGRRRYLVYAAVYLAPYLRTNLSLSPDESWLPVASIFICILHIQLEASIRSGDIESFKFIQRAWNLVFPRAAKEKDAHHGNKRDSIGMPHEIPAHLFAQKALFLLHFPETTKNGIWGGMWLFFFWFQTIFTF
ncbi:hypothetical protein ACJX0J_041046, partial [Zea mays]